MYKLGTMYNLQLAMVLQHAARVCAHSISLRPVSPTAAVSDCIWPYIAPCVSGSGRSMKSVTAPYGVYKNNVHIVRQEER